jgi:hypothetical protein
MFVDRAYPELDLLDQLENAGIKRIDFHRSCSCGSEEGVKKYRNL